MRLAMFSVVAGVVLLVVGVAAYDWRPALIAAGAALVFVGVFWEYDD